ncbi:MAG: endonuclease [Candidatus Cloacimonetes bacterium]|nr:endonuclease [Candidatus Cloacimonadota bacterium]
MKALLCLLACLLVCTVYADDDAYYAGLDTLEGDELKAALHERIKGHTAYPYFSDSTGVGEMMMDIDADPADPTRMILFYTGRSQPIAWADHGDDFDYAAYGVGHGDTWNREHLWAKSHGFPDMEMLAYTDIHHLRPADRSVNGSKGAKDFDWGGAPDAEAVGSFTDFDSWEPRDEVKGDLARSLFYMAVRYEGTDTPYDLELVESTGTGGPRLGRLSTLLEWHAADPPDDRERARNERIYTRYQHNRNPFIDHPEYAVRIWGEPDTTPRLSAALPWIDFGDVVAGEASEPVEIWLTGRNQWGACTADFSPEGFFAQTSEPDDWLASVTIAPAEGAFNQPLALRFQPVGIGEVGGELSLRGAGGSSCRVALYGRGVEAGTRTLLASTFDDGWEGWTVHSLASDRDWRLSSYDSRRFAKISGYRGDEASDDWLVSPQIDLSGYRAAALRFETAKNHSDDIEGLEAMVCTDYSGNPATTVWERLQPRLSPGRYEWVASGWLDLEAWEGRQIRVAFRYRCTGPQSATTWEIDDIRLTAVPR